MIGIQQRKVKCKKEFSEALASAQIENIKKDMEKYD